MIFNAARAVMGRASACGSVATVRSSKLRFAIDEYTVCAIHTGHACATKVITMVMTFDGQRRSCKSKEECGAIEDWVVC